MADQSAPPRARPTNARPVVACQSLTKVFKDFWMRSRARAVDSVTFEIRPHEVFGLLGPNGSGKSTTIKMILGLLRPTRGRIAVFGKPPSDVSIKKRIGYLPEESYMYPFLNARETLDYYGKLFELDHKVRRKRIDELLDMVGLAAAQFRPVREYSKGMQRRIGLAQALINDPDLLILDEPTTGLDPIGTRQVKDLIVELGRRGKTVLLSSHLLADVEDCVDRMVILYGGKIRREGGCADLLESRARTTIETDALDEDTLAEIDRIIRQRSEGAQAVLSVSHPRQKLEELFLELVEQARAERLENAGVQHGGQTASFLRVELDQSDDLIQRLVADEDIEPAQVQDDGRPEEPDQTEDQDLIGSLVGQDADQAAHADEPSPAPSTAPSPASRPAPGPADTPDVDLDVIESLVEPGPDDARREEEPGR